MNLQEELKALNEIVAGYDVLKQRIYELEEQAKEQQVEQTKEFPQNGDEYWYVYDDGDVFSTFYDNNHHIDRYHQSIGNFFQTEEQAEFLVEKLKVEAELRKFSRPFEHGENNHIICIGSNGNRLFTIGRLVDHYQGAIYFESRDKAQQAIKSVGEEHIKKYIFGVED